MPLDPNSVFPELSVPVDASVEPPPQDIVRVLRLIEYEGPRHLVEKQVRLSLHGTRQGLTEKGYTPIRITATTLGIYPEVIEEARRIAAPDDLILRENAMLKEELEFLKGSK